MSQFPSATMPSVLIGPPKPTWFDRHWPAPTHLPGRRALLAIGGAAAVAASVVPLDRPGIGWFLAASAITAAIVLMRRGAAGTLRWPWLVLALALMAVGGVRASHWLFASCVVAALGCASLAVAGGRSARGVSFGLVAVGVAAARAVPWVAAGARALRAGPRPRLAWPVAIGAALLVVFGSLFAAADAAFARLLSGLAPDVAGGPVVEWAYLFCVVALGCAGAGFLLAAPASADGAPGGARRRVRLVEWALPVGVLVALFAAFIAVQVAVLFGGQEHVLRTAGLTYAEYARSGFWQLLVVTALTLAVITVAAAVAPVDTPAQRLWLRGLLGSLTAAALVVVASALGRLWLYQQTYGFTVLRLQVGVAELWLGLVCAMVLVAGVRLDASWLPRAVVGSAAAVLLGVAALDPEDFVADRNVERLAATGRVDAAYLGGLSADAVPALAALPEDVRGCVLAHHARTLRADYGAAESPVEWNLARSRARAALEGVNVPCG